MNIGFIVFQGMTMLDFVGFYDPVTRLKTMGLVQDIMWDICSFTDDVVDTAGLQIKPNKHRESLSIYDMVFFPGGFARRNLICDRDFMQWIQSCSHCKLKVSVCTGALILGKAGFLKEKRATTHPNVLGELKEYCREVVNERVVDEGDIITARGVTSSIDLGLYICKKLYGKDAQERIASQMDYHGWDVELRIH